MRRGQSGCMCAVNVNMEEEQVGPLDGEFQFKKNTDGTINKEMVICTHCRKEFRFHRSYSSLKYHLEHKHPGSSSPKATASLRQTTLTERRPMTNSTKEKLTNTIAEWIAKDCRPISIVEDKGLAKSIRVASLDPSYKPPCRTTIMTRIHSLYETEKKKKEEALSQAEYVALTGDHWTSVSNTNYLGVTAHHITKKWELVSFALTVIKTEECDFASACAEQFQTVARKWDIEGKITIIATDSAHNMVAAARILPYNHMPCIAHIIQRSITVSLADSGFDAALAKCRKIVGHFKQSPANLVELNAVQKSRKETEEPLTHDVSTRWNSTLEMVQRLSRNQAAIKATLSQQQHKLVMLTRAEWDKIHKLETLLEPCRYVTELLGGEAYVSCSMVLPALRHLQNTMEVSDKDPAYVVKFKEKIKDDLTSRQQKINQEWLKIATALDPRFKDLKSLPKTEREGVWTTLGGMLRDESPRRSQQTEDGPPKKKMNLLLQLGSDSESEEEVQPDRAIQRYRAEPIIDMEDCPLRWWSSHAGAHEKLAPLARKYLSAPATSVPCERLFSVAGHVVNKKRAALLSENVNKSVCLSDWLEDE
ncbi:E3 SUMO-protein ligase ZBED1-like [Acanthochromis polyacanthus]|uniref:E3 SUMO-protein ligase ZBED1-like n=1 Tax=Acanthochromis polyacanthus TaxID=80966 RepID=UPI002233E84F|nr:E3 SUMO-protein ligase ZBED1-like [Acanthochromis polyacanthus]